MSEYVCVEVNKVCKLWLLNFQVALAEAEQKFERAKVEITQLENNKAEIESNIRTLLDMASDSAEQLCETRRRCDEVTRVSEINPCIQQFL